MRSAARLLIHGGQVRITRSGRLPGRQRDLDQELGALPGGRSEQRVADQGQLLGLAGLKQAPRPAQRGQR